MEMKDGIARATEVRVVIGCPATEAQSVAFVLLTSLELL
jgi:hypothetical protein